MSNDNLRLLARGMNPFQTDKRAEGEVKYLKGPQDVIKLVQSGDIKKYILLVRGGTTTFLAPALSMGATGILTMSGAPESHLGILSREFQTPCAMTIHLAESESRYVPGEVDEEHFGDIVQGLEGKSVVLDATEHDLVMIYEKTNGA